MRGLAGCAVGYVVDFFRERVAAADFASERIGRVLVTPDFDEEDLAAVRRLFPDAEVRRLDRRTDLWRARKLRFDVACVAMKGGAVRERLAALASGARHRLLVPSPDYVYRLGMRSGVPALLWGAVDRFLVAPLALVWLAAIAIGAYTGGLVRRAAVRPAEPWLPGRVLVIRLMPTRTFVHLLERIRRRHPRVHLAAVLASEEGREEVAGVCDEVVSPRSGLIGDVRRGGFDTVILAGGADYGFGRTYLKAALLARLCGGRRRHQWEVGEELPGAPLGRAVWRAAGRGRRRRGERRPGPVGRALLRQRYAREPERGPTLAQIGITKACNYHCLFCPFHSPEAEKGHKDAELPRMSYEMFARLLGDLRRMGTRGVDICGDGEPLTHPEGMEMIALARELGFDVTLATNAALLTEEKAQRLVEVGVRRMHVSFNAATPETYAQLHPGAPPDARRKIAARLREMTEYAEREGRRPIDVEFSAVLNRLNMDQIPRMVEAAHEARAGWFMLILMGAVEGAEDLLPRGEDWVLIRTDLERARQRARELGIHTNFETVLMGAGAAGTRSVYERIPCYIGHEYALILADGSAVFCCQCSRPLGNLNEDSFEQIWKSEAYREARRQARALPETGRALPGCECFEACSHVVVNVDAYRKLHGERALRLVL